MAAEESILGAFGGLNQDDSLISPPKGDNPFERGDYRYARNTRIGASTEDHDGSVENFTSTLAITNYYTWDGAAWISGSAPAGTNIARGKYEDVDEGAIYWAVYNSNGNHQILKFVKSERKIYALLSWSGLNFAATNIISMSKVSTYLVFTCRDLGDDGEVNPPRLINTSDIHVLKSSLAGNFSEYHISFAKWSPLAPPYVIPNYNITPGGNLMISKGLFQFTYRYVYYGGLKSTWGPSSNFISIENGLPQITELYVITPGFIHNYESGGYFTHSQEQFYKVVQFIEYAFRQSTLDAWKLFRSQPTGNFGDESRYIRFSNNGPSAIIDAVEMGQYFDSVPFSSASCEVIDSRVMFADNDDDMLREDFAVENVETYQSSTPKWNGVLVTSGYSGLTATYKTYLANKVSISQTNFKSRGIYKLGIIYQHFTGRTGLVISPDNWTYLIPENSIFGIQFFALGFNITAGTTPPVNAVAYQIVRTNVLNIDYFIEGIIDSFVLLGAGTAPGAPTQTAAAIQTIMNEYNNSVQGASSTSLAQRLATNLRNEVVVATIALAGRVYLDLAPWYLETQNGSASNPSDNQFYSFQEGDRVRFSDNASGTVYDVEIVDFDGKGIIVNKPSGLNSLPTRAGGSPGIQFKIEIYRTKLFANDSVKTIPFYEIGEWYPITNPGTPSRDFEKRDFTWTAESDVTITPSSYDSGNGTNFVWFNKWPITNGDVHWLYKTQYWTKVGGGASSVSVNFQQMNQDKDDAAGNWEHNTGRPLIAYKYNPISIEKQGQIRFGLRYLEDSIFIAINTFFDSNQFIYPGEYGKIRGMKNTSNAQVETVGNILLVFGEAECWSVYVNRTTLEDLSGRSQVSISDKVLGSYNTLLGSFGTLNPESISAKNGRVIWWSAKKGVWVRYSRDGITEVSKYKMTGWFKDISLLLINEYATSTPPKAISVFDDYYDEWLTRIDHSSLPGTFREYDSYKCVSFSERADDKRWKSVWDYNPDLFASLDNEVYSLVGSTIQIHDEGADFGSIYGTPVPTQIEFVANSHIRAVKIWEAVTLISTDKWSFERIRGDWRSNSATIQESRLTLASLEDKEDTFWSEIKRDKNSPNAASEQAGVINGNVMRSRSLRLLLQLDPTVDYLSVLNWLAVSYNSSPKNLKK